MSEFERDSQIDNHKFNRTLIIALQITKQPMQLDLIMQQLLVPTLPKLLALLKHWHGSSTQTLATRI